MDEAHRIIIAERDAALAAVLTRHMLRYDPNVRVEHFSVGQDVVTACKQNDVDLLVISQHFCGVAGPALIRTVRTHNQRVPIIGMANGSSLHPLYRAAGASVFVEQWELITHLSALLRRFLPPIHGSP